MTRMGQFWQRVRASGFDSLALDVRLAVRMLAKHRGLTVVGSFAMAVAIAISASTFEAITQTLDPALPIEDGERVVAVYYATQTPGSAERRVTADFLAWREGLSAIEQLSAFRTAEHNVVGDRPPHEAIQVAEMSASAFAVARTPPMLGRYLLPADERPDAPPVIVIGYHAWQTRFAADPHVVGRTVNLGGTPTAIVGVMPDGFRFPFDHQYWIPLRLDQRTARFEGPRLFVFGRLAPGKTMSEAQAEVTTMAARMPPPSDPNARLRPMVLPYTHEHMSVTDPFRVWVLRLVVLFVAALTFVVAINLAILVYARTVTRFGEIAVRTALGASRTRILTQLFVESFALAGVGAVGGLLLAQIALERLRSLLGPGALPFWIELTVSPATVLYAIALAALAAAIMGVLPGLKATSGRVNVNLRELDARTGARLGATWTTLVVTQIAIAVAILPLAVYVTWEVVRMTNARPEPAAEQFVVGFVGFDREVAANRQRIGARYLDLVSRLQAEPGISAVTFSSGAPGFAPGRLMKVEPNPEVKYHGVEIGIDVLDVGVDLFAAYDAQIVAGRGLTNADVGNANTVVVNRSFAAEFLRDTAHGLDPAKILGVRFRYIAPYERPGTSADATYEVVGVVRDFPSFPLEPGADGEPTVYHAASPGDVHPIAVSARFEGTNPNAVVERFRVIAAEVDPSLQLHRVIPLTALYEEVRAFWRYLAWGVGLLTASVLLLSAAGVYAMMSFTVAQRSREIAIRAALGAAPHRLVLNIFGRASGQLALGLAIGILLAVAVFQNIEFTLQQAATATSAVAAMMTVVALLAALGPVRRGLRIDASEVLKADA